MIGSKLALFRLPWKKKAYPIVTRPSQSVRNRRHWNSTLAFVASEAAPNSIRQLKRCVLAVARAGIADLPGAPGFAVKRIGLTSPHGSALQRVVQRLSFIELLDCKPSIRTDSSRGTIAFSSILGLRTPTCEFRRGGFFRNCSLLHHHDTNAGWHDRRVVRNVILVPIASTRTARRM